MACDQFPQPGTEQGRTDGPHIPQMTQGALDDDEEDDAEEEGFAKLAEEVMAGKQI